jgi:hypothetical protein
MTEGGRSESVGKRPVHCEMTAASERPQHFVGRGTFIGGLVPVSRARRSLLMVVGRRWGRPRKLKVFAG